MQKREQLPLDVVLDMPLSEAYSCARTVRRCLCKVVAAADIECDPLVCSPKLRDAIQWAKTTNQEKAALCGASKRIYREYAKTQPQIDKGWAKLLDELFEEEEC